MGLNINVKNSYTFCHDYVVDKIEQLTSLNIGRVWVTEDQINKIIEILDLNNLKDDELTAVRNSIVQLFCKEENKYYNNDVHDMKNFDKYHSTRSAVTAVIDDIMFKRKGTL